MKPRQRGISLIGVILMALLLGGVLLIGFKMVGPYKEYFALQHIIVLVADEGNNGASEPDMRESFARRANIDSIDNMIRPNDLVFRRQGERVVIEVEYSRKVPLVSNISLLFDFKASNQHK
ncbi:MAG: DUF4845 domain-containing protein [Betaproteobacteria bacterium]|nr:DUF4845 domain-containing protein [Betaproteobacteria bacterium]